MTNKATDMKMHDLKTDPSVFQGSWMVVKPWEIRFNDRDFKVGDIVNLRETLHSGQDMLNGAPLKYTDRTIHGTVTAVISGYGLQEGWVVLTIDNMVRFWGVGAIPQTTPTEPEEV